MTDEQNTPMNCELQFRLDAEHWEAFMAALDAPSRAIPALEKLMREPSVFEVRETGAE